MKNKKILIVGSDERFALERMYYRAFKEVGSKVDFLHVFKIRKQLISKFIWKYFRFLFFFLIRIKIFYYLKKNQKKYDLIIFFKGLYIKNNFLKILKKNFNSKIINIYSDNPLNTSYFKDISNQNVLNSIPVFDYFFIFSKKILKKISLKLKCNNIFYLPFANDPNLHKKKTSKCQSKYDISFVGTADRERFLFLNNLKNYKIILAGDGWKQYNLNNNVNYIGNIHEKNLQK